MIFKSLLGLVATLGILAIQVSAQATQSCKIDFYYDFLAELDCNGAPLNELAATAGKCVDISTVSALGLKHWQAFQGKAVPTGCSRKLLCRCLK